MTKTTSILKVAFRAMGRNKMRSLLTALGIIIGVACVVATIGIGEGARVQAESQLQSLGTNFLMIFPGTTTSSGARSGWGSNSKLSEQDVDAIRQEVSSGLLRLGVDPVRGPGRLRQPELVDVDPGGRGRLARHPLLERGRGAVLHRRRQPCRGEGLRPREDRGDDPLRRRGPRREDDPDQEHPVPRRGRPRAEGGLDDGPGPGRHGDRSLPDGPQEDHGDDLGRHDHDRRLLAGARLPGPGRDQRAPPAAAQDQQGGRPGGRLHDPVADRDARSRPSSSRGRWPSSSGRSPASRSSSAESGS